MTDSFTEVRELNNQLRYWSEIIDRSKSTGLPTSDNLTDHILTVEDAGIVGTCFAIGQILVHRGRLLEHISYINHCWPARSDWCVKQADYWPLRRVFAKWNSLRSLSNANWEDLVLGDLKTIQLVGAPSIDEEEEIEFVSQLDLDRTALGDNSELFLHSKFVLYSYRDAMARNYALETEGYRNASVTAIDERALYLLSNITGSVRKSLAHIVRSYSWNDRLNSTWEGRHGEGLQRRYAVFEHFMKSERTLGMNVDFHSILKELDLAGEAHQELVRILERLQGSLSDFDYSDVSDQIRQDGGQWGPNSGVGSSRPINVIPSRKAKSACCDIALCLAEGRSWNSIRSFTNVSRKLRQHMINCVGITKYVLFLTDVWDPRKLEESSSDFSAHAARGAKILFFLVNQRKLTLVHKFV